MWLIDAANAKGYGIENIMMMLLLLEFTALHTTASVSLCFVLLAFSDN